MSESKTLLELQSRDTQIQRAQKELDELPELKSIMECRAKRKEIKGKQDQVVELMDETETKLADLQAEEEQVVAKIKDLQEKLDANADYRETANITRDMETQVKRQKGIAAEQDELLERQIKIDKLAEQVREALARVDHAEEHHLQSFKDKGMAIKNCMEKLKSEREELKAQLDAPVANRYEALLQEKNGIAVCTLEDDHCSACRSIVLDSVRARLKKGEDLIDCPNCHRMMVVEAE